MQSGSVGMAHLFVDVLQLRGDHSVFAAAATSTLLSGCSSGSQRTSVPMVCMAAMLVVFCILVHDMGAEQLAA